MTIRRHRAVIAGVAVCAAFAVIAAGCSGSSSKPLSTLSETSTTIGLTTTAASTTSVGTTTSTTPSTTAPPTTTLPPGAAIALRADGLGDALFGAAPDGVLTYITGILGAPATDSGWVSAPERTCPGTEVRGVSWGDLSLLFGDETGLRQFFGWSYGPAQSGTVLAPAGMATAAPARISIGSTVAQVIAAYPDTALNPGDDLYPPSASFGAGLLAFVTNIGPTGVVTSMLGGGGCGE